MRFKIARRALYKYKCEKCHKDRGSLLYERAGDKICSKCRRTMVPENQPSLFKN